MLNALVKQYIDPELRAHGFRRKGLVWNRSRGQLVDIVTLQKANYSTDEAPDITGNVGICIPNVVRMIFKDVPARLTEADAVARLRFGSLLTDERPHDKWWTVTWENLDSVGNELAVIVRDGVLPFFDSMTDLAAIDRFLDETPGFHKKVPYYRLAAALLKWKLGKWAECEEMLERLAPTWQDKVNEIRQQIAQAS